MNKFDLDSLMDVANGGMKLTVFDSRYNDGIVTVLTYRAEHGAAIEDKFSSGDTEWEAVCGPLSDLGWFPMVYADRVDDAIPALRAKLEKVASTNPDVREWRTCVEWLGILIAEDRHFKLLYDLKVDSDLRDLKKAYEILGDLCQ